MYNSTNPICITQDHPGDVVNIHLQWTGDTTLVPTEIKYSYDKTTWTTWAWTGASTSTLTIDNTHPTIYLEGNNATFSQAINKKVTFTLDAANEAMSVSMSGNICSLLADETTIPNYCFIQLFGSQKYLHSVPDILCTDIGTQGCMGYAYMSSIVIGPKVGFTSMTGAASFSALCSTCNNLEVVPAWNLNCTVSMAQSFTQMFYKCSKLVTCPIHGTITLTSTATMVCNGLFFNTAIKRADTFTIQGDFGNSACSAMFSGCSRLVAAPTLSIDSAGQKAFSQMFKDCTQLTTLPNIMSGTTWDNNACQEMYANSGVKLSTAISTEYNKPFMITGTSATDTSFANMFTGTGGTFTDAPALNTMYYCSVYDTKWLYVNNKHVTTWNTNHQPKKFNNSVIINTKA